MNAKQAAALNEFKRYATMGDRYEIKDIDFTECEGDAILVNLEIGMPNDEGTMAEYLCRDNYLFFIGPRGGLFIYEGEKNYRAHYFKASEYRTADIDRRKQRAAEPETEVTEAEQETEQETEQATEDADALKTYPTTAEAYSAGARDLVQVIDHETAARAFEAGEQAAQEVPAAHNRRRVEERTRAIDRVVSEHQRYADKAAAAQHIAGKPADYLHRHTINFGTSRYPDHRPEYEQYHADTLILHGTASKSGKSIDRLSTSYAVLVID